MLYIRVGLEDVKRFHYISCIYDISLQITSHNKLPWRNLKNYIMDDDHDGKPEFNLTADFFYS